MRPGCIWLAESVEPLFIAYNRANGTPCLSDAELYRAFDLCYDYDTANDIWPRCATREARALRRGLNTQEGIFPENYVKLRFLENHDRPRAGFLIPSPRAGELDGLQLLPAGRGTGLRRAGARGKAPAEPLRAGHHRPGARPRPLAADGPPGADKA